MKLVKSKRTSDAILIVGTGALASLFAARLAAAGYGVQMLGTWPEGVATLKARGVTLMGEGGQGQSYAVRASSDAEECREARFALVLVKSWQTARAARQLSDCLSSEGVALTLQNGLGNREQLVEELGEERVALGVTTAGATLIEAGKVRAGGEGKISLGKHARLGPLADMLQAAGFDVEGDRDVESLAWSKLVINAAINPLTALLEVPNGEVLKRTTARALSAELARETAAVASAQGIGLTLDNPVRAAEDVARRTAENHSSMLQDVRRGAPTEIDAICGAVVRAGERAGVPTPVNGVMWQLVRAKVEAGISETGEGRTADLFPEPIRRLPKAEIPVEGVTAHLLQGESQQILFMHFAEDVELPEHAHEGQWGVVLEGTSTLTMQGESRTYSRGERYFIPAGVPHSSKIHAGYSDITFFDEAGRYSKKIE